MIEEIIYMPPLTARLPCLVTAMMLAIACVFLSSVFVLAWTAYEPKRLSLQTALKVRYLTQYSLSL